YTTLFRSSVEKRGDARRGTAPQQALSRRVARLYRVFAVFLPSLELSVRKRGQRPLASRFCGHFNDLAGDGHQGQQLLAQGAELAFQLRAALPFATQIAQQAHAQAAILTPLQQLGILEVETLVDQREQRLEQAFLGGEGEADQPGVQGRVYIGETVPLAGGEDLATQPLAALCTQQPLQIDAHPAPLPGA